MRAVNQPESWWGWHGWNQPEALSIVQIMQAGTLPPRMAAAFWLGIEHGASFVFAAEPPGAGKTTIRTALLPFVREETLVYFTRGWGETFDLPPPSDDHATYIMVNEMSDHLPVYSWGPYVVKSFELLAEGYSLATTLHAETVEEVIAQLVEDNAAAPEHVARLEFVVPMVIETRDGQTLRRVRDVGLLSNGAGGVEIDERGYPDGKIRLTAKHWREIIALARRSGAIGADLAEALTVALGLIALLGGDRDKLDVSLKFRRGEVWIGPLSIGRAPRLAPPRG